MRMSFAAVCCVLLLVIAGGGRAQVSSGSSSPANDDEGQTVLKTSVRRVVLDVVVSDAKGVPYGGLTASDFSVTEDGKPQRVLSFDAVGFSPEMDYVPQPLPPEPPNTFINMPSTPEKGPLYVLLYDLVNMDSWDHMNSDSDHGAQMFARQQMMRFIQSKPEGTRFAIFVRSDGLHLVQGFTSDKALLYSVLDPKNSKAHVPKIFLMAETFGRGDKVSALHTLHAIAGYLDGLPGRKNLLWYASQFPLSFFAAYTDGPTFTEESRATLDLLAHNQIAVYPIDARGVPLNDTHQAIAANGHNDTYTATSGATSDTGGGSGGGGGGNAPQQNSEVQGPSSVISSYNAMDSIARQTGGRAFYGTNDVAGQLIKATESGGAYYTLTYASTNSKYDGTLRHINVGLAKKGYDLAYRRSYYGTESHEESQAVAAPGATPNVDPRMPETRKRAVGDTLSANMQYGAPESHQLVFVVEASKSGVPAMGTPEEMADLATEPAYFKSRRRTKALKPLAPIPLQKFAFSFDIPIRQFNAESSLDLEIAAAAFDADGQMMNAIVSVAKKDLAEHSTETTSPRFFRMEEGLEVPTDATSVRVSVRDTTNDRIGAMDIKLPLAEK